MTLSYTVKQALQVPDSGFNRRGIAQIEISGTSLDGKWWLHAVLANVRAGSRLPIGCIEVGEVSSGPDFANRVAKAWIRSECVRLGYELRYLEDMSYAPQDAALFAGISCVVARSQNSVS